MALARQMFDRIRSRRTQLGLAIRVTVAAVAAYAIATALHLLLPLWAVLTSLIVTQMSVGRSLKATRDYVLGTIGGAIYGGAIAILIPYSTEAGLLALLVLAVAPLAFVAAINPSLNAATVTAIIVLLVPTMHHSDPMTSAIDRVSEVGVGAITGLLVSFLVLPSRAVRQIRASAARLLELIADAFTELLAGLTRGRDNDALHRIQDGIGTAMVGMNAIGAEAERERAARLSSGPDTGPLLRTVLRLRHDVVMIGRATVVPLPVEVQMRLAAPLAEVSAAIVRFLRSAAEALRAGAGAPPIHPVHVALQHYAEAVAAVRQDGLIRGHSGDTAERFFAIGFSLEQMHQNLCDLDRVVGEWSEAASDKPARVAE
ncbi:MULTISPECIES: FUSC family protein [Bradyrhizobium]|uniref:Blr0817 protein n=1 Tax=Bradyrhizobium diazoefficiens (strain JCM 10833 / BCRC 13528 / IAM 13628 / NBRC 14792 / USDA 110) TaxID=224911 RepID=Q89W76_BRADU|nr:FUSC family protein [Bradyrhizobium diazoefficiens]AND86546.1 membrane protein [Bradyrhizobium diazoefficiens USDA 110]AWO87958.1 FUSC family protein [Bradyrhizobium diazoefficiens]PDT62323.1 FUSC family protein [Bradyrhizobium diazoefficiens]QBP19763.1 FUSC family protein [Bradyrhizobium diazoefficiens]QLD39527.1 FUSC family protein [Bradyrhizobium diazoefficiens]